MNKLLDMFLASTYTVYQAKRRSILLRFFLNSQFFGGKENLTNILVDDQVWLGSLDNNFIKLFNKQNTTPLLKELSESLKQVPILTLVIATELPEDKVSELGNWVRTKFQKQLLLETKINPLLIAGCALVWKGIYTDYSLKSRIEAQQQQILSSFKTYLK